MARFPETWWKSRPLVFGHRGASRSAPENTLASFEAAAAAGADGIELDVHLTADGVPVVIHNARVETTTSGTGRVSELPLAYLKSLDAGACFGPGWAGERVPTLEEVLLAYGHRLLINIELKPQPRHQAGLERAVMALVVGMKLQERVLVSSFKPYALHQARSIAPEVPCGLLYSPFSVANLLLAPVTPFEALHPHYWLVNRWFVAVAHRMGSKVVVWTVDDTALTLRLAEWGVDVLITNDPVSSVRLLERWTGRGGSVAQGCCCGTGRRNRKRC